MDDGQVRRLHAFIARRSAEVLLAEICRDKGADLRPKHRGCALEKESNRSMQGRRVLTSAPGKMQIGVLVQQRDDGRWRLRKKQRRVRTRRAALNNPGLATSVPRR